MLRTHEGKQVFFVEKSETDIDLINCLAQIECQTKLLKCTPISYFQKCHAFRNSETIFFLELYRKQNRKTVFNLFLSNFFLFSCAITSKTFGLLRNIQQIAWLLEYLVRPHTSFLRVKRNRQFDYFRHCLTSGQVKFRQYY